ncbi:hypothetical protein [uncultured Photobacterium sp.]|uniref:hypothetical protein n=1 Tax=uncultured Photobacterium sp. TaxID=173973 RepID=UPI002629B58C|nr:hypothetical protein [uncultured Photobacterium sp.]
MHKLPEHGRIQCTRCYSCQAEEVQFDKTKNDGGNGWRISNNPLAWGCSEPEIIVLGFSKGPTQVGALLATPHNKIAYKGSRKNVDKILSHIGLLEDETIDQNSRYKCDALINESNNRFHFGSLIRCTVEQLDAKTNKWKGSGGGMLDKFVKTDFGSQIANNCTQRFLVDLPERVKLIVMFGLGTKLNYVREAYKLFSKNRPGNWKWINDVSYTDGKVTVVHVEHFASQGALIPNWLGENNNLRQNLGLQAQTAVKLAINDGITSLTPQVTVIKEPVMRKANKSSPIVSNTYASDKFCMRLKLICDDGIALYPVKLRNRTTGIFSYRVSNGSNRKEDAIELFDEDIDKLIDMVVNQGYGVRASSLDKARHGIYGINKRSVHSYEIIS